MAEEWGPWIEHDGAEPSISRGSLAEIVFQGCLIVPEDRQPCDLVNWPGFYWRWTRVRTGLFSSVMRRVCDDPAYAPVIRYRIRRPRGMVILEALLENLPEDCPA